MSKKRIGLLTGGGDAPGLNGVIESCVRALSAQNLEIVGIRDGFEGVYNQSTKILTPEDLIGIHSQAGTLLGTSNKVGTEGREQEFLTKFRQLNLAGLIAVGGDGTFGGLQRVAMEIPMIGVPKTIDNDLSGTDLTFGFDTACAVVSDSVDALRATADAHRRIIVVETMGRTAGWIALGGGLASYADAILIPERPYSRTDLVDFIKQQKNRNRRGLMIVASEGATAKNENVSIAFEVKGSPQKERFGGFSLALSRWLEKETDWEARNVVLGHLQRSRHPTTTDRFLTLSMGVEVAKLIQQEEWNQAVVYRQGKIQTAPITDLMKSPRLVAPDHAWVKMAQSLQIYI